MQQIPACKDATEDDRFLFSPATTYRIRLAGLIAARCLRLCCPFQIKVKGVLDYENQIGRSRPWIVIRYYQNGIWRTLWLFAVLPRVPTHKILLSDLLREGPTSLPGMFQAFRALNHQPLDPNCTIVLYTSQALDSTLKTRRHRMPGTILDQPHYEGGFIFTKTLNPQIYAPEIGGGYPEFVRRVYVYTSQPGTKEIEDLIAKEICIISAYSKDRGKKETETMLSRMATWWRVKCVFSKLEATIDEKTFAEWVYMRENVNRPIARSSDSFLSSRSYTVRRFSQVHFKRRLIETIQKDLKKTKILTLTAIKPIERALCFVLVVRSLVKVRSIAIDLSSNRCLKGCPNNLADALVVWSGPLIDYLIVSTDNGLYDITLMETAWYNLRAQSEKRLILVVPEESSLINSLCSEFNGIIRSGSLNFNDLTMKSQKTILNKTISVYGREMPLQTYLSKKETFEVCWLDELSGAKPLEIIPVIPKLNIHYRHKKLIPCVEQWIGVRVKIITGLMGCGKTTFLHASAKEASFYKRWHLTTDLADLDMVITDTISSITDFQMAKIIVDLQKNIKLSVVRACFRQALLNNPKLLLCIDGWDDVPKQRKHRAIEILEKIVSPNFFPTESIYITCSSGSEANMLAPLLNANIYELEAFTDEDEFIVRGLLQPSRKKNKFMYLSGDGSLSIWKSILGRASRIVLEIKAKMKSKDWLDPLLVLHRVIAQRLSDGKDLKECTSEIKVAMYYYVNAAALLVVPPSEAPSFSLRAASRLRQAASSSFDEPYDPLISKWIGFRPRFRSRILGQYFAGIWLAGSYQKVSPEVLRCIFESDQELIRSVLDLILSRHLPLHYAITSGYLQILPKKVTIKEVTKRDIGMRTPLHLVCSVKKAFNIAERLLQIAPSCLKSKCSVFEWTPVQYAVAFRKWDVVELFLRLGAMKSEVGDVVPESEAIFIAEEAIRRDYPHLLFSMIYKGEVVIDEFPRLLSLAAEHASLSCAQILIKQGINIHGNLFLKEDGGGESLLKAISMRSLSVANLLIKAGADPSKPGKDGISALGMAEGDSSAERLLKVFSL